MTTRIPFPAIWVRSSFAVWAAGGVVLLVGGWWFGELYRDPYSLFERCPPEPWWTPRVLAVRYYPHLVPAAIGYAAAGWRVLRGAGRPAGWVAAAIAGGAVVVDLAHIRV